MFVEWVKMARKLKQTAKAKKARARYRKNKGKSKRAGGAYLGSKLTGSPWGWLLPF